MNKEEFISSLKELKIDITDDQLNMLETYYEMLVEYNKVMNLTGIIEHDDVYLKHYYDSLTITKVIDLNSVDTLCDFGTGAGFPGLVIKILFPNVKVTLIDSLNKRIKFLNDVINKLGLKNISCIHGRIEEYAGNNREIFDIVTCRAVAQTNILLEYSAALVKVNGYFIPLKGKLDHENDYNNAASKLNMEQVEVVEFKLPKEESERTIIKFKKVGKTPKIYPRRNSEINKKPL